MLGNMIGITDDSGAVASKYSYIPFGEVIAIVINQPTCDIPVGFAGSSVYFVNLMDYTT